MWDWFSRRRSRNSENPWERQFRGCRDELYEISGFDPFEGWSRNRMVEGTAADGLRMGLEVWYGGADDALAEMFFRQAISVVARAMREGKLTEYSFPLNRGSLLRTDTYSKAMIGADWSPASLGEAAQDYLEWCDHYRAQDWDSQAEAYLLNAVRMFLVAGTPDLAAESIRRRSFRWHSLEASLLARLAAADDWLVLRSEIARFFDPLRAPEFRSDIFMETHVVRFEWAVLLTREAPSECGIDRRALCEVVRRGASR